MSGFLEGSKGGFILIDYIITALAIIGNCLVLESVAREHFGLTLVGYRYFLISLSISDIYICGVNIATFIHNAMVSALPLNQLRGEDNSSTKCFVNVLRSFQLVGYFANLYNLCGISMEHYVGTMYPVRYRAFMSKKLARTVVGIVWTMAIISGAIDLPITAIGYSTLAESINEVRNVNSNNSCQQTSSNNWQNVSEQNQLREADPRNKTIFIFSAECANVKTASTVSMFSGNHSFLSPINESNGSESSFQFDDLFSEDAVSDSEAQDVIEEIFKIDKQQPTNESEVFTNLRNLLFKQIANNQLTWCAYHSLQQFWLEVTVMGLTLFCFAFLFACYGVIFRNVFQNAVMLKRRTMKLVITTTLYLTCFAVCWLPMMIYELAMLWYYLFQQKKQQHIEDDVATEDQFLPTFKRNIIINSAFNSLLIAYPLIDPIIYAARLPVIQRQMWKRFRSLLPCVRRNVSITTTNGMASSISGSHAAFIIQRSRPTLGLSRRFSAPIDESSTVTIIRNNANYSRGHIRNNNNDYRATSTAVLFLKQDSINDGSEESDTFLRNTTAVSHQPRLADRYMLGRCLSSPVVEHVDIIDTTTTNNRGAVSLRRMLPTLEYADDENGEQ